MSTLFISALVLGLVSNLHCVGMCGPLVFAMPFKKVKNGSKIMSILLYNLGRILVYGILGFIVGLIGMGIQLMGVLQGLSIISGIGIILFAWRKKIFSSKGNNFLSKFTSKAFGKSLQIKSNIKFLFLGFINGILPCGMVYTALLTAILAPTPIFSFGTMLVFGLGTLPAMILLPYLSQTLSIKFRSKLNVLVPYLVTLVGILIVLRGMNLDIPYVSPSINENVQTKEVKMECCHR